MNFVEWKGKLFFATHVGYYSIIDGMEKIGIPPEGWKPYPGGHFLSYDMESGKYEDYATAPKGEGWHQDWSQGQNQDWSGGHSAVFGRQGHRQ